MPTNLKKPRVLFIAEAATLAHVTRPLSLLQGLAPARYDTLLAWDARYQSVTGAPPCPTRPIFSIPSEQFLKALASGSPIYSTATLERYVKDDLALIKEYDPTIIVGDFRLSLSISARISNKPYVTISNAYWSPYARLRAPVPEIPLTKILGVGLGQRVFDWVSPLAFAYHTLPLNTVRKRYGLPSLGMNLRRVYTDADYTLYADIPQLVPTPGLPAEQHRFIGPVLWSPPGEPPSWWNSLPTDRPVIYVTLGSSGQSSLLPAVLSGLAELPISVIVATAGRAASALKLPNLWVADYLPGEHAAARAALVVCNGGSPTAYQALAAGTPVLGIPTNLDQYLNMAAVERAGAGRTLRSGLTNSARVKQIAQHLLTDSAVKQHALRLQHEIQQTPAAERFAALIAEIVQ